MESITESSSLRALCDLRGECPLLRLGEKGQEWEVYPPDLADPKYIVAIHGICLLAGGVLGFIVGYLIWSLS